MSRQITRENGGNTKAEQVSQAHTFKCFSNHVSLPFLTTCRRPSFPPSCLTPVRRDLFPTFVCLVVFEWRWRRRWGAGGVTLPAPREASVRYRATWRGGAKNGKSARCVREDGWAEAHCCSLIIPTQRQPRGDTGSQHLQYWTVGGAAQRGSLWWNWWDSYSWISSCTLNGQPPKREGGRSWREQFRTRRWWIQVVLIGKGSATSVGPP